MKKPYKDFDLTRELINTDKHFVPPKARRPEEIERRKAEAKIVNGTFLSREYQRAGSRVGGYVFLRVKDKADQLFAGKILGICGFVSGVYEAHDPGLKGPQVMSRRGQLAFYGEDPELMQRPTTDDFEVDAFTAYEGILHAAGKIATANANNLPSLARTQLEQGRLMASMALGVANISLDTIPESASPFRVSDIIRNHGLQTVRRAHELTEHIGTPPSLAQLADPYSDLSVYLNREAPDGFLEAYEEASAYHAMRV